MRKWWLGVVLAMPMVAGCGLDDLIAALQALEDGGCTAGQADGSCDPNDPGDPNGGGTTGGCTSPDAAGNCDPSDPGDPNGCDPTTANGCDDGGNGTTGGCANPDAAGNCDPSDPGDPNGADTGTASSGCTNPDGSDCDPDDPNGGTTNGCDPSTGNC